jgi:molybdopterin/thiamine biosynthesis adenylyltransferase/rhodanese-related sulfurtransferase
MTRRSLAPLVEVGPPLTPDEGRRYSRHLLLPQIGEAGQRRLRNARVCVVGAGGLGSPVLLYLAAAGVGRLGIVDDDRVDESNLQRQVIHGTPDIGRLKVDSARDRIRHIDPGLDVVLHPVRLSAANVEETFSGYDLVIDGTDNFPTRYLINDACARLGLPLVWGSVYQFDAQVAVFWARPPLESGAKGVQLRDLFPTPPPPGSVPSCAEGGVLGALCGQVGAVMATEAVKLIIGAGTSPLGRILVLDGLDGRWTTIPLMGGTFDPTVASKTEDALAQCGGVTCGVPVQDGRAEAVLDPGIPTLTPRQLRRRLEDRADGGDPWLLVDVREPSERAAVSISGSISVTLGAILDGSGLDEIPRDTPLVLYCRSGVRSEQAARRLMAAGYGDVAHLAGGVLAWTSDNETGGQVAQPPTTGMDR